MKRLLDRVAITILALAALAMLGVVGLVIWKLVDTGVRAWYVLAALGGMAAIEWARERMERA